MEHYFELPVTYKEEERHFKGRLATFGYVYKFYIVIDGQEWVFEKDDEQQYRVLTENNKETKVPDAALFEVVIEAIKNLSAKNV